MSGDGSWFDTTFDAAVSSVHIAFFGATVQVNYTPPQSSAAIDLANVRLSDEITETSKSELEEVIETVRYMLVGVNSGNAATYSGVTNFQQYGQVQINNAARYVIDRIIRHSSGEQEIRLTKVEPTALGSPDR